MNTGRMKVRRQVYLWMTVIVFGLSGTLAAAEEQPSFTTENDKASYVTGVDIVRSLIRQGGQLNLDLVIQGIMDGFTADKLLLTEKELQKTLTALRNERKQRQACQAAEFADNNKAACIEDASFAPTPASFQGQAQERKNEDERISAALFAATLAPPRVDAPKAPAVSQALASGQTPAAPQSPVVMLAAQMPAKAEAPVIFERSELARKFGDYWLQTHPH